MMTAKHDLVGIWLTGLVVLGMGAARPTVVTVEPRPFAPTAAEPEIGGPEVLAPVRITAHKQGVVSWDGMVAADHAGREEGRSVPVSVPLRTFTSDTGTAHGVAVGVGEELEGPRTTAPTLVYDFQGADVYDSGFIPPDTMGAIGPSQFVIVINGNVSVYNRWTGSRLSSVSLNSFFSAVHTGNFAFDPRVLFDQHSGRWVAMAADCTTCDPNYIVFAVSATDNATGSWFQASFSANGFADYPTLGVDEDGIYVAASVTNKVWAIEKAPLLSSPPSVGTITQWSATISGALQPAHTYGTPGSQYFVRTSTSTSLRIYELQGPLTSPTLTNKGAVSVPYYQNPPNAPALGSTTEISVGNGAGGRPQMAMFRAGSLWTCQTVSQSGRCACRWYEIDPVGLTLLQSGTVGDTSLHYYYPSLAVNMGGDVAMGFSGSDATQYVGAYFTGRQSTDPAGQMGTPVEFKAGEAPYNVLDGGGRNRWGDYSYTTLDPLDESAFWTIQEYAGADGQTNAWGTWIAELSFGGEAVKPSPEDEHGMACSNDGDCWGPPYHSPCIDNVCYVPKNKYLSFEPGNGVQQVALRVKLTSSTMFPSVVGSSWWVQAHDPSDPADVFRLGCAPHYQDWSAAPPTIHVGDLHITPNAIYDVQAILIGSPVGDEGSYSPPLSLPTANLWGDTVGEHEGGGTWSPPDGVVGLDDIMAAIGKYQSMAYAPSLARVDTAPADTDGIIGIDDIMAVIAAFQGGGYPYSGPVPCTVYSGAG